MRRLHPISTRTDTLFPYTTLFLSIASGGISIELTISASEASGAAAVGAGVAATAGGAVLAPGRAAPLLPMSAIEKPGPTGPESRSTATPIGAGVGVGAGLDKIGRANV